VKFWHDVSQQTFMSQKVLTGTLPLIRTRKVKLRWADERTANGPRYSLRLSDMWSPSEPLSTDASTEYPTDILLMFPLIMSVQVMYAKNVGDVDKAN